MSFILYPQFMPYPRPANQNREFSIRSTLTRLLDPMQVQFQERDNPALEMVLPWCRIEYDVDPQNQTLSDHRAALKSVEMAARGLHLHLLSAAVTKATNMAVPGAIVGAAAAFVPAIINQEIESATGDETTGNERLAATLGLLAAGIGLGALVGRQFPGESQYGMWIREPDTGQWRFQEAVSSAPLVRYGRTAPHPVGS